jgi:hypothetical protein
LTREGCEPLIRAIYEEVASHTRAALEAPDPRFASGALADGGNDE